MNSQEAINALFEGKKVKRCVWEEDYIYMEKGHPVYPQNQGYAHEILFYHNDWEICKVMYQWLCYDNVQKEFFLSDYIEGEMKYALGETRYKVIKRLDETRKVFK